MTGSDQKIGEVTGTRETEIDGNNVQAYRKRVKRIEGDTG